MCGRYNLTDSPLVQALLDELGIDFDIEPRYNIAPTESVPVIVQQGEQLQVSTMRWWLVPRWSQGPSTQYAMFNARRESLLKSRAYSQPYRTQRGILPATSFVEWQTGAAGKQPLMIEAVDQPLALAAIWEYWDGPEGKLLSCAIITQPATPGFRAIHDRMPHILPIENYRAWLAPDTAEPELENILADAEPLALRATPVSTRINNSRYKESDCVQKTGETLEITD